MRDFEIYSYQEAIKIQRDRHWPVIYLLKNEKKIYIGESTNVQTRFFNHSRDIEKKSLTDRYIIKHNKANKSLALLIESDLINRAFADRTYSVVNKKKQSNMIHNAHDFYGKEEIKNELPEVWNELKNLGIFTKDYYEIENEELFKYSPWKEFNENQVQIIDGVVDMISNNENAFVHGSAGTGKTLVIIRTALDYALNNNDKVIGIYSAKKGNHATFNRVFKAIDKSFKKNIKVISDLNKETLDNIDYLLIDEGQRLRNNYKFSAPKYFIDDLANDEIEWLNINNIKRTIYYDLNQSFHKHDIDLSKYINKNTFTLVSQFRMKAGNEYIRFVKEFLGIEPESNEDFEFGDYSLKSYSTQEDLFKRVLKENNSIDGMDNKSRMLASLNVSEGDWITQNVFSNMSEAKNVDYTSIRTEFEFGDFKAVWNKKANYSDWLEKSDVSEVGCVHTAQGRDFRYAGILFANDIKEDGQGNIIADPEVINSYFILMTRGIYGHGLHFSNESMNSRFKRFKLRVKK